MPHLSHAKAVIRLNGPDCFYPALSFTPVVANNRHEIQLASLRIRKNDERYTLETLPLTLALPMSLKRDVVYWTYELDEDGSNGADADDRRLDALAITVSLADNSDQNTLYLRAVEKEGLEGLLFFEVRDESDDWRAVEDTLLVEVLSDSFLRSFETMVLDELRANDLDALPMMLDDIE